MNYIDLLQNKILEYDINKDFDWSNSANLFIRYSTITPEEISTAEERLKKVGYSIPDELKAFWSEIGCGCICSNFLADNVIENPSSVIDIYFSEGEWSQIKTSFILFSSNELPFCRSKSFNYITIGLEPDNNLGKIYLNGDKLADSLSEFLTNILQNPIYYERLLESRC